MERIAAGSLLLCFFLLFSCEKPMERLLAGGPARVEKVREDDIDGELLRVAQDARDTLPGFFRHLTRPGPGEGQFCVKYPFFADDGSGINREQLWLTKIHFKDGQYYGIVANTPLFLDGMKKGDTITIEMDSITDWMYVRGGKIIGGYSIRYLLEKTPQNQLNAQDQELRRMLR